MYIALVCLKLCNIYFVLLPLKSKLCKGIFMEIPQD